MGKTFILGASVFPSGTKDCSFHQSAVHTPLASAGAGGGVVSVTDPGCVSPPRWGDRSLLGPRPAGVVLRQLRPLCHHVGHRWEKRDSHRAPRTQVRLS